ncbi:hypothetical protein FNV43_RR05702 [Rhamnella rubrinervis]|uniref:Uncharacterized protein n=1 Tax=Rhamnella rubrinervis TaxID=2594499 RepID=A0A8K0MRC8_9ROSA|nr:hypothetical protein FNV43_RR05702 [Rhamnella rubrinervis]
MAFIDGTIQLIREYVAEGSFMQQLSHSASTHIHERIAILTSLSNWGADNASHEKNLTSLVMKSVYVEVDRSGKELVNDPDNSLPSLLLTINALFSQLETSIGNLHAISSYSFPLLFEKLPEVNQEGSQWTDCEIKDAINLVYLNLSKLDSYLSFLVAKHRKPRKVTQYWISYTCGAVGLSICSVWLLRHSSLMGSPDIDNWVREARNSTVSFFNDHVEQPGFGTAILSPNYWIIENANLNNIAKILADHIDSGGSRIIPQHICGILQNIYPVWMLLAFSEQTKGQKFPENASDQEMLEIVMARYEKELMHPIQNLLSGELARALLIQVQKLKLDIETAMLEIDQILRANEINFAILAALPAFFLSLLLLMLVRAWLKQDTRAEGRGRVARLQRRLLLVEVEKKIMQYQTFVDQGLESDAQCTFGLLIYSLGCLYHAVERHAKASGEWQCYGRG